MKAYIKPSAAQAKCYQLQGIWILVLKPKLKFTLCDKSRVLEEKSLCRVFKKYCSPLSIIQFE